MSHGAIKILKGFFTHQCAGASSGPLGSRESLSDHILAKAGYKIRQDATELYALELLNNLNGKNKRKGEKMMNMKMHLDLLGMKVEDRITGFRGVVATVGFDLYGCVQAIVNPGLDEKGDIRESRWFDVNRLVTTDPVPVMDRPNFEWTPQSISEAGKGPAERPAFYKS